jgi:hypothetical protein
MKKYIIALEIFIFSILAPNIADSCECIAREKYSNLRYLEDWSSYACQDISSSCDWTDQIKYVPLGCDGCKWISFGGQLRFRGEYWENFGFADANDDAFLLTRLRLHADAHFGDNVRVFVEGKSALCTDRDLPGGRRTLDVDTLDLLNAFVDFSLDHDYGSATARLGLQELSFGNQRLVSPLDWANSRRNFFGASLIMKHCDWTATGFYTKAIAVSKHEFNETANDRFYGIYIAGKTACVNNIDLYYLGRNRLKASYNDIVGAKEKRNTFGVRVANTIKETPWDYEFELAYQTGDIGPGDISAFMFASKVGYSMLNCCWKPKLHLGYDYSSGDEKATDSDVETFSHLYPLGHAYHGWIDVVGRQNISTINPGITLKPSEKLVWVNNAHWFWRAEKNDALYNAGAGIVRAGGLSSESYVGFEFDSLMKYKMSRHWKLLAGYSQFFSGAFIKTANPAAKKDIRFAYAGAEYTF